jgi:serine/threonine protein kinase/tetratricopeptide (TPR) repeat protein
VAAETPSLDSVFCTAIDIASPQERDAYLARACGNDAALSQRVRQLVAAHFRAGHFLEEPAGGAAGQDGTPAPASAWRGPLPAGSGVQVGPYKLLEQLGEGGMGSVFLAEQSAPVRRQVALKVIRPGMDSRQVIARFEAERQALALMDHPNIARILDAGTTAGEPGGVSAGRPYFVMELVRGTPITAYCDENRLTVRRRLGLFVSVCRAVQHAHQKGVIHRDLKPSNILVTAQDGAAVVKVIDFGIAKAIGQQLTEQTLVTGFVQMVGTPLYMSPEQAGSTGLDVDTRSDVYSLGVLLYELLTGTTPFGSEALKKAGYDELRRIIREDEPPRPGARLSAVPGETLAAVAGRRGLGPAHLVREVRGELDWIVMKALEKDRHRRYESAGALAQDVERYLSDESVQACPPSAGYRLRKFLRRNKAAVATAGLLAAMLLAVAGSIGWVVREKAERRSVALGEVRQMLLEVNRLKEQGRWAEALREVRNAQARLGRDGGGEAPGRQVREDLDDLTLLVEVDKARLRQAEVNVREHRFAPERALPDYARAFAAWGLRARHTTPDEARRRLRGRPDVIRNPVLAALYDWHAVATAHRQEERDWLGRVIEQVDDDPWRAAMRRALARNDVAALEKLAGEVDVATQPVELLTILGRTLKNSEVLPAAAKLLRRAHLHYPGDFWVNHELGNVYEFLDEPANALPFYLAGLSLRPSVLGYLEVGSALRKLKQYDASLATYRKMLALEPDYGRGYSNLGNLYRDMGRVDEAILAYRQALDRMRRKVDYTLDAWPVVFNDFGWALAERNEQKLTRREQGRQLAALVLEVSGRHIEVMYQEAAWRLLSGDREGYRRLCTEMLKRYETSNEPRPPYLLARMFCLEEKPAITPERARSFIHKALAAWGDVPWNLNTLGLVEYRAGRYDEAIQQYRRSMASDPKWAGMVNNWVGLAAAYRKKGEGAEAGKWMEKYRQATAPRPLAERRDIHPHDRIACQLLLREVEGLLGPTR